MDTTLPAKSWPARIENTKVIADGTYDSTIKITSGNFSFTAGQYVWVVLPELRYEDPKGDRRAFSICSAPSDDNTFSIVFRDSQSGYKKTFRELPAGSQVSILGPFGSLALPEKPGAPVVFVAGGTGIAPFLSLSMTALTSGTTQNITLLYANSSKNKAVYRTELSQLSAKYKTFKVFERVGKVDWNFLKRSSGDLTRTVWYIVGPRKMVEDTAKILYDHSIPEQNVRFEEYYVSRSSSSNIQQVFNTVEIFKLAVESSFSHVVLTDVNGIIVFVNAGAEKITGFTRSEMVGQTPRLWGGLMDKNFYSNLWQTIKVEKKPFEGVVVNRRKNGEFYQAVARISPILDKSDNLIGFMGTEEDVSKIVSLEDELKSKIAELEKLNKLFVGRELKMQDLKQRILDLQSKRA